MSGIVHVGAYDGAEYLDATEPLLLFEPQPEPFERLMQNMHDHDDVILLNAAAGAKPGMAVLYQVYPDEMSSLFLPVKHAVDPKPIDVNVTTVDAEATRYGFQCDLLRVDTQGYELEVLKGAVRTLANAQRVECELHDPQMYPGAATVDDVDRFLAGWRRMSLEVIGEEEFAVAYEPWLPLSTC